VVFSSSIILSPEESDIFANQLWSFSAFYLPHVRGAGHTISIPCPSIIGIISGGKAIRRAIIHGILKTIISISSHGISKHPIIPPMQRAVGTKHGLIKINQIDPSTTPNVVPVIHTIISSSSLYTLIFDNMITYLFSNIKLFSKIFQSTFEMMTINDILPF